MIKEPLDVLEKYEVRKSGKQKTAFICAVKDYATDLGYSVCVEKGSLGVRNVVFGDAAKAKYLVTAHYDTCPWMPLPNFVTPCNFAVYLVYQLLFTALIFAASILLAWVTAQWINIETFVPLYAVYVYIILFFLLAGPANPHTANDNTSGVVTVLEIAQGLPEQLRDQVAFILFDLEESGCVGSASYRRKHRKEVSKQIVLNLDCVGDGEEIVMFPTRKFKKKVHNMEQLSRLEGKFEDKLLRVHKEGFAFTPSDQMSFPVAVGIMSFHRSKLVGIYCSRIHTHRDTVLDMMNVNILRDCLISFISSADA